MLLQARLFVIGLGLAVLGFVVNLVRTKRLKEEYALLWLLTAAALVIAPLSIDLLDTLAYAVGIEYPPAFLFLVALIGVLFILFQFSVSISRFSDQIKALAQDLALLADRVDELQARLKAAKEEERGDRTDA